MDTLEGLTAKERIRKAFKELRTDHRIEAHMNWQCCNTCGCAALTGTPQTHDGYVFYHHQNLDAFDKYGDINKDDRLWLCFWRHGESEEHEQRCIRVGDTIVNVLHKHGLRTEWNRTTATKIAVINPEIH